MIYIYVLHLIPRLTDATAWTSSDEQLVNQHFQRLERDKLAGKVLLAGRTSQTDSTGFGIVIFQSTSMKEAHDYMQQDPSVQGGIMTAEVHEFRLALWGDLMSK